MKRLTIWGIIICAGLLFSQAAFAGNPAGPPGGLGVQIVNPLPVPVTGDVNATVSGDVDATVSGEVSIVNTPTVEAVQAGEWSVSLENLPVFEKNLSDGSGTISLESVFPRQMAIPAGVAMTDVIVQRANLSTSDDTCAIWFYKLEGGGIGPMITLRPSVDNPTVELHFKSGLRSTETREIGFYVNSNCRVYVLWTGYEY